MTKIDILILLVIGVLSYFILGSMRKARKSGRCLGCSSSCKGVCDKKCSCKKKESLQVNN